MANTIPALTWPFGFDGGLAIGKNLNAAGPSPTFYTVGPDSTYFYYNGTAWVNTGHLPSTFALSNQAINIAAGGNYVYSLVGSNGQVYRYDGTGNAVLITTIVNWNISDPYDLSADCNGNFYALETKVSPGHLYEYNSSGSLINSWTVSGYTGTGGGGLAVINNHVYFDVARNTLYGGVISTVGGNINLSAVGSVPNYAYANDFASCPFNISHTTDNIFVCSTGTGTTLNASGGSPYTWSVVSGPAVITGGGAAVSVIAASNSVIVEQSGAQSSCVYSVDTFNATVLTTNFTVADPNLCTGEVAMFTNTSSGGATNTVWNFGDGMGSNITSPTHTYAAPGIYTVTLTDIDTAGCRDTLVKTAYIHIGKPNAGFSGTTPACLYDSVHFADTSSGQFSPVNNWRWNLGDGTIAFVHNPVHNYQAAGSFPVTLIVTDASGCKDSATNIVTVRSLPSITAIGDSTICPGDSARVTAQGGSAYTWSPAATVHCASCGSTYVLPATPTNYVVTGADAYGCKNTDTVKIAFTYKTKSYPGPGGQLCIGRSIVLSDSGAQKYSWYPPTGLSDSYSSNPLASPSESTIYMVIAQTGSCIADTGYVNVTVHPSPKVTALGGGTVLAGAKVNLQAYGSDIVSFLWNHADVLSCDDCTDPIATMQQTTLFTVTGTNQYGCVDSANVLVDVLCDKSQVFIPNTFTPNGDGQNDVFYARGVGIKTITSFRIYNRWGELIFEGDNINLNDESSGWDGGYKGAKPLTDTYVYVLEAVCDEGQSMMWKGNVTLVR